MVTAIAGRLRLMGLPTDAIVGIQLPNIVENILVMLGVLRAGMIAASLPLVEPPRRCRRRRSRASAPRRCSPAAASAHSTTVSTRWRSRRTCFPSATCADSETIFPTGSCRLTICSPRKNSTRSRRRMPSVKAMVARTSPPSHSTQTKAASCRWRAITPSCWPAASRCCSKAVSRRMPPFSRRSCHLHLPASASRFCRGSCAAARSCCTTRSTRQSWAQQARENRVRRAGPARAGCFPLAETDAFAIDGPSCDHRGMAIAGVARGKPGLARAGHRTCRRSDLRRSGSGPGAPQRWRQAQPNSPWPGLGAARKPGRGRRRRGGAHRGRHACAPRADGAAPCFPARNRSAPACPISGSGRAAWSIPAITCRIDSIGEEIVVTGPPSGIVSVGGYRFPLRDLGRPSAASTAPRRSRRCPIRSSANG